MNGEIHLPTPQGWSVGDRIGSGSCGSVYRIMRTQDGTRAALKVISIPHDEEEIPKLRSQGYDNEAISRLLEQRVIEIFDKYDIMKKMSGEPNIVRIDDVEYVRRPDGSGCEIIVRMEELTPLGRTLERTYSENRVVAIANDVLSALERYEQYRLVHGSIKPENILVTDNGGCKLSDFGVSDLLGSQSAELIGGACDFMAPEVFLGKDYDNRADIYSVGMLIYWLCNNYRIPFLPTEGGALSDELFEDAIARRVSGGAIPDPVNGSAQLKQIIGKACSYDPQNRYRSASAMRTELSKLLPQRKAAATVKPMSRLGTNTMHPYEEPVLQERKPTHVERPYTAPAAQEPIHLFENDFNTMRNNVPVYETKPAPKKKKKNSTTGIVAAISGMILVAAICVGVVLIVLMTKDGNSKKTPEDATGGNQTPILETNASPTPTYDQTTPYTIDEHPQVPVAIYTPNGYSGYQTDSASYHTPESITTPGQIETAPTDTPTPKPTKTPKPTNTPKPTVAPLPNGSYELDMYDQGGVCIANSNCHLRSEWYDDSYDFGKIDRADSLKVLGHHPTERWALVEYKNKQYWMFDGYIFGSWMIPSNSDNWNKTLAKYNHGIYNARKDGVTMPDESTGDHLLKKCTYYYTQQRNTTIWRKFFEGDAATSFVTNYKNIEDKNTKVIILYERTSDEEGNPLSVKWYFCAYHEQNNGYTTTYFGWIDANHISSSKAK